MGSFLDKLGFKFESDFDFDMKFHWNFNCTI